MAFLSKEGTDLMLLTTSALDELVYFNEDNDTWEISFGEEDEEIDAVARLFEYCKEGDDELAKVLCVLLARWGELHLLVADWEGKNPKEILMEESIDLLHLGGADDVGGD
jgi:hypothetical protein